MRSIRLKNLWDTLTSTLWFVPATMTIVAIIAAVVTLSFDRALELELKSRFLYSGGPEGARAVLATTAGSMITVAGIAFSTTMVALSFASSQLGPRLLRNFMRDRGNQVVLGTFIATFVYCILVLRSVNEKPEEFVPHIGVTVGLALAMASLGVLIYFIHHAALALQADYVIGIVADELDHTIEHLYPGGMGNEPAANRLGEYQMQADGLRDDEGVAVSLEVSGYVHTVDIDSLLQLAASRNLVVRILSRPGKYEHDAVPVAMIWPAAAGDEHARKVVREAFTVGRSRTPVQDVEFAVNQLVEVALRALSPGINDPFTAVTCIDRLTTAVLHLMRREFPSEFRVDDEGRLRVIAGRPDFGGVVDAAFNQIRQAGGSKPAVTIRLLDSLTLLLEYATSAEHRRALEHHVELVRRAGLRNSEEPADRADIDERAREGGPAVRERRPSP